MIKRPCSKCHKSAIITRVRTTSAFSRYLLSPVLVSAGSTWCKQQLTHIITRATLSQAERVANTNEGDLNDRYIRPQYAVIIHWVTYGSSGRPGSRTLGYSAVKSLERRRWLLTSALSKKESSRKAQTSAKAYLDPDADDFQNLTGTFLSKNNLFKKFNHLKYSLLGGGDYNALL